MRDGWLKCLVLRYEALSGYHIHCWYASRCEIFVSHISVAFGKSSIERNEETCLASDLMHTGRCQFVGPFRILLCIGICQKSLRRPMLSLNSNSNNLMKLLQFGRRSEKCDFAPVASWDGALIARKHISSVSRHGHSLTVSLQQKRFARRLGQKKRVSIGQGRHCISWNVRYR